MPYSIHTQRTDAAALAVLALDGGNQLPGIYDAAIVERQQRSVQHGVANLAAVEHTARGDSLHKRVVNRVCSRQVQLPNLPALGGDRRVKVDYHVHAALKRRVDAVAGIAGYDQYSSLF